MHSMPKTDNVISGTSRQKRSPRCIQVRTGHSQSRNKRNANSSRPTSTKSLRTSLSRKYCCRFFGNWGSTGLRRRDIRTRRWNMAKIFGCNTHCRLSTSFTSASKQKFGKLDSAGASKNANVAEIHNQVLMMLAHEVFDPEIGKRVLIDHAFIVAGGEITKAARNWLGNALDARKRSQLLFLDRDDTLNLFIVNSVPLPVGALPPEPNFWRRLIFHFDGVPVPASQLSSKQDVSAHASATGAATILARVLFLPGEWSIRRLFPPKKDGASPKGLCSLAVATSVAVCDRT